MLWVISRAPVLLSDQTFEQELLQAGAGQRIERAERFVEQQEPRIGGKRAGDTDPLAHAAREFPYVLVTGAFQTHLGKKLVGTAATLSPGDAPQLQRKGDIVTGVEPGIERIVLEDDGAIGGRAGDVLAVDRDAAGGWFQEAGGQIEKAGLAGAGAADERNEFIRCEMQRHAIKYQPRPAAVAIGRKRQGYGLQRQDAHDHTDACSAGSLRRIPASCG